MRVAEQDARASVDVALYSAAEAARILRLSPSTLGNWIAGYTYPTVHGRRLQSPLITRTDEVAGKVLPFTGMAEAYVLSALKAAGVSMHRIRPAVEQLKQEMDLEHALLSERLKTDGVDVLFDYLVHDDHGFAPASNLAVVQGRDRQLLFRESVESYLRTISYGEHGVSRIQLPFYTADVVLDPRVNAGRPTLASHGIRVEEIVSRVRAGDSTSEVSDDFEIPLWMINSVLADAG